MKKPVVLIIDDEIGPRESLRMILKEEYDLLVASDGKEGISLLEGNDIDLIITDIKMPEVSGLDVLKRTRQIKKDLPVIMITGYASEETNAEAISLGVTDYIRKPYDVGLIRLTVERALQAE